MDDKFSLFGFSRKLQPWQKFLPYALLLSITFALYGPSLYYNFEWDDHIYIDQNIWIRKLSALHLGAMWSGTYVGHYAPVLHTFLAMVYHVNGADPFSFHLAQFLLHAACACTLYLVLEKMESSRVALLSCLLFVVHPTNIETVAWVAEIKSTLAFLFFLLSFLTFLRMRSSGNWRHAVPCTLFLILSILSKINTVVAPAVFLLYDYRERTPIKRETVWSLIWFFFISAISVAVHLFSFFWSKSTFSQTTLENAYFGGPGLHLANIPFMVLFYIRMLVFPYPLTAFHMFRVYQQVSWVVAFGWLVMLGMGWLLYRSDRKTQFWGLWFFLFLAPVLQIIPNLTWVAERYLYIPAIGAFVILSNRFFRVGDRLQRGWPSWSWELAMGCILLVFSGITIHHLPVFRDDVSLWEATAQTCQTSATCHAGLGVALLADNQVERGVKELIRAVEIRPNPGYLGMLGDAFTVNVGDYGQAIIAYKMALAAGAGGTQRVDLYAKLARAELQAGNMAEVESAIQEGSKLDPNNILLVGVECFYEWKRGNLQQARRALQKSLSLADQTSGVGGFLISYWGNAAEVGRLLADLRTLPEESAVR